MNSLLEQARNAIEAGDYPNAIALLKRGIEQADSLLERLSMMADLALVYVKVGETAQAEGLYNETLDLARQHKFVGVQIGCLMGLARLAMQHTEHQKALKFCLQIVPLSQEIRDHQSHMLALNMIGANYGGLGKAAQAIEYHHQALQVANRLKDGAGQAQALSSIGAIYVQLKRYDRAESHYQQALDLARQMRDGEGESVCLSNLGMLYMVSGRADEAIKLHLSALQIARERGDKQQVAKRLSSLGISYRAKGQLGEAVEVLEEALEIFEQLGLDGLAEQIEDQIIALYQQIRPQA